MQKVIMVEGYKAFAGWMAVHGKNGAAEQIRGDWLYRPDTDCWYCKGRSYPAECCEILEVQ